MGRFLVFLITLLDLFAMGCTYLYGAIIVPNIFNLAIWLLDILGRMLFYLLAWGWLPHLPVLPFPLAPALVLVTRNRIWGLLWLGFYMLMRLSSFRASSLFQRFAPANAFYPDEARWTLVAHCLQQYEEALMRFAIPPVRLKVPRFLYEERAESITITWQGYTLVLPTSLLTNSTQQLLAVFLALELAKYQGTDLLVQAWMSTYPYRRPRRSFALAGICFWMPASVIRSRWYKDWHKQRELEYDEFVYLCGQGEVLLKILLANEANKVQMLATDYEPSTLERIGALEALLRAEYAQMAHLGLEVPRLPELFQQPAKKLLK